MGTVLFFTGQSANGAITDTVRRDARLLEQLGHQVQIADLGGALELPDPAGLDLIVGYQCWGLDIQLADGRRYVEAAPCPYAVVLGDHPIHHARRVLSCPQKTVFCVGSQNQVAFLKGLLAPQSEARLLPAAMFAEPIVSSERDIDALFVGHVASLDDLLAEHGLPQPLEEIVREFVARSAEQPYQDPVADYMVHGFERVLSLVGDQMSALNVGRLIDLAVRHTYRWASAEALRKLPVTLVGDQWVSLDRRADDAFTAFPSVPYGDLAALYSRSKIVLHIHPPYFDFHERIIDGMTHGAAVAFQPSPLMSQFFTAEEQFLSLPDQPDALGGWLDAVLADPERVSRVGIQGQQTVKDRIGFGLPAHVFHELLTQTTDMGAKAENAVA